MEDISYALLNYDSEKLNFIYSDDNSKELIGRISLNASIFGKEDEMINGLYDQTDVISIFKDIQEDILNNIVIKGIENVNNIVMIESSITKKENKEIVNKKEWTLETDGTNLFEIFNSNYVDFTKTVSNDIIEVYEILGIEAARNILLKKFKCMSDALY